MGALVKNDTTKPSEIPKAPGHLSKKMKEFWVWAHTVDTEGLNDQDRLILIKAAEAFDEAEKCRRAVKKDGMTVVDRFGQKKPHPLLTIEQNSRMQFAKLIERLYLHVNRFAPWQP